MYQQQIIVTSFNVNSTKHIEKKLLGLQHTRIGISHNSFTKNELQRPRHQSLAVITVTNRSILLMFLHGKVTHHSPYMFLAMTGAI